MAAFPKRIALATAAVILLSMSFILLASQHGYSPAGISLDLSTYTSSHSAIDDIARQNVLPQFWTTTAANDDNIPGAPAVGVKIKGLVFYGRRDTVPILDCYLKVYSSKLPPPPVAPPRLTQSVLQRNLARNGGVLNGVIFAEETTDPLDLAFLDQLLLSEPESPR
jgi:hypothetical protein